MIEKLNWDWLRGASFSDQAVAVLSEYVLDLDARLAALEGKPPQEDEALVDRWLDIIYNEYWEQDRSMSINEIDWLKPILMALLKEVRP